MDAVNAALIGMRDEVWYYRAVVPLIPGGGDDYARGDDGDADAARGGGGGGGGGTEGTTDKLGLTLFDNAEYRLPEIKSVSSSSYDDDSPPTPTPTTTTVRRCDGSSRGHTAR